MTLPELPVKYEGLPAHIRVAVREEYIKRQGGRCWYCHSDLYEEPPQEVLDKPIDWTKFPKFFLKAPIHLQHDHDTGLTEAAVHAYCNAVLWQYWGI